MFSRKNLDSAMQHYFYGAIFYGIGVAFYLTNNYYSSFLKDTTKEILITLYISYLIIAPIMFFLNQKKDINEHKPAIIIKAIKGFFYSIIKHIIYFFAGKKCDFYKLNKEEKTAILFMLVKLFYLPIMLNFLIGNYHSFFGKIKGIFAINSLEAITYSGFVFALSFIFLVDVAFFAFGYLFEAKFLKNKVRSVEPTFLGWAVALICYPPFNTYFTNYVGWAANDYVVFSTLNFTFIARIFIVFLLSIYLWATISLGTKCSNLTNRGIITTGAYKYIRHPAYIAKNLAWWITIIPIMSISVFITMFIWSFIYYLRAITEENHLMADPEFKQYCKKTKYKFIPFVW